MRRGEKSEQKKKRPDSRKRIRRNNKHSNVAEQDYQRTKIN